MNQPLVSVITVNFRQAEVTCAMLDSIRTNSYKQVEVIVVDNGSLEDRTLDFKAHLPEVNVIVSKENLGFAGGNNLGINEATGAFLFFANNDTIFTDGLLEALLKRLEDPTIGAVSPKIRYFDYPEVIQYAGFTPINSLTARNETLGKNETDKGQHDKAIPVPYCHGAAMLVKREVISLVGKMPEAYFLYYEELDWCEQMRRAGYQLYYEPQALIYHKESMAVGKKSTLKTYYITRNRILFMRRNASRLQLVGFYFFLALFTFPKGLFLHLINREWQLSQAFIKAIFWHFAPQSKHLVNS